MRYIFRLAMFVLLLLSVLAVSAHAQTTTYCQNGTQCSCANINNASITPPSATCPYTSTISPPLVNFTQQQTATFLCSDGNGSGAVYASHNSAVTGYGQAHCTPVSLYCYPNFVLSLTLATSPTDYNRFYNQAYDDIYTSSGCVSNSTIGFRQDFWQCLGVACSGGGGGWRRRSTVLYALY